MYRYFRTGQFYFKKRLDQKPGRFFLLTVYLPMRYTCVLLFILQHNIAFSQFNDSVTHNIKLNCTGLLNKTTTGNSYILSNGFGYNVLKKTVALNTAANWVYGVNKQVMSNNDLTTHADLNFFKENKKLSYWTLVNYDKIYSLNINYRLQGGGGISYNFIDSSHLRINVSYGLLYEAGDIKESDSISNTYATARNSLRLLLRWIIKDKVTISSIHFYQPSFETFKDYIIQSTTTIAVKLYRSLSLNANVVYNKATNTNRDNLLVTYGLMFDKYF